MGRLMLTLAVVLSVLVTASASSVHLKGGNNAEPFFVDLGLSLDTTASLSGLGEGDIQILIAAQADVISICTNQGGNAAPGQNPADITITGGEIIPSDQRKNGELLFELATVEPVRIIPGAPDCANPNWTEEIVDLAFTQMVALIQQPPGTTVLTVSCVFDPPTANGVVSRQTVSCSQQ